MKTTNDGENPVPRHLDGADLISYLDGELTRAEQEHARTHLESCWNCRSQLLAMQNSIEGFLRVRKQVLPSEIPPSSPAVAQFRRRLAQHASVPVSPRLRLTNWLNVRRLRDLRADFNLILKYKKTAFASALVVLVLFFTLVDPFNWNRVSADELLNRAGVYEFLNELPAGKVVRTQVRIDRIALSTKTETRIGEVETAQDDLTSGIYISANLTSGAIRKETAPDSNKLTGADFFTKDLKPETAEYLNSQNWFPQVSVSSYRLLIAGRGSRGNDGAFVTRHGDSYELHHPFAPSHASGITETVLLLSTENYAPQGVGIFTVEGNEHFEYRLTRTSFERVERTPELAQLFETPKTESGASPKPETSPQPSEKQPDENSAANEPARVVATAELEVEVLGLLNQIGADLGQEVIVTRVPGGVLKVEATVDTEKRKREILSALAPVATNPAINIQVETAAELQERTLRARSASGSQTGPSTVTTESVTNNSIPVQAQVRQYLISRGISEQQVDTEVGRTANQIVMRSHRAMLHVWALKSLIQRFSAEDLRTLDADARANWLRMISTHAREFQKEALVLRQELTPIFNAGPSGGSQAQSEIADEANLIQAVSALIERASSNHEVVRSAFTISTGSSSTSAITTPQFWRSLSQAESIAASIQSTAQRLK
jgi:hypothetical protein